MKLLQSIVFVFSVISLISIPYLSFADDDDNVQEDTCATEPTDMTVNYGDYITCSISPKGDSDTYRIWGNEGDRMSIEVVDMKEVYYFEPWLLITTPNGETLFSKGSDNSIEFDEILTETGKYTIRVSDSRNNESGQYTIYFLCNGGSCLPAPSDGGYQEGYDKGYIDGKATCEETPVCSQVITYGKVPNADCWVEFPTPCDVPEGWESTSETPEDMCGKTTSCDDRYDEGYQAGIATCDNSTPVPNSNCATFDLFTNTLKVPCLDMGSIYWVDMMLEGNHLTITGFGKNE